MKHAPYSLLVAMLSNMISISWAQSSVYSEFEDLPEGRFQNQVVAKKDRLPDEFVALETLDANPAPAKKVALYVDSGVWDLGQNHFKKFLINAGFSYKVLNSRDIQSGALRLDTYDLLLVPGGKSWIYLDDLGPTGAQAIREFVDQGGGYFGTCAGAFYATSHRKDRRRNNIPYGIGLLEGTAYDGTSLGTSPFRTGMMNIDYRLQNFKTDYRVLMYGGPALLYSPEEAVKKNIKVLATFGGFNQPAMIIFNFGKGRVSLVGPHGEIEEGYPGARKWKDPDSEWPILKSVVSYLRGGTEPALKSN